MESTLMLNYSKCINASNSTCRYFNPTKAKRLKFFALSAWVFNINIFVSLIFSSHLFVVPSVRKVFFKINLKRQKGFKVETTTHD